MSYQISPFVFIYDWDCFYRIPKNPSKAHYILAFRVSFDVASGMALSFTVWAIGKFLKSHKEHVLEIRKGFVSIWFGRGGEWLPFTCYPSWSNSACNTNKKSHLNALCFRFKPLTGNYNKIHVDGKTSTQLVTGFWKYQAYQGN